jgi:hypothetical protein
MTHSQKRHPDEATALEELAALYPLAFALASASGFRTGLALQRRESARLLRVANPPGRPNPFAESASSHPR